MYGQSHSVRLVIGNFQEPYMYEGLYMVLEMHHIQTAKGNWVFKYLLDRFAGQV